MDRAAGTKYRNRGILCHGNKLGKIIRQRGPGVGGYHAVSAHKRNADLAIALMREKRVKNGIAGDRKNKDSRKQRAARLFEKCPDIRQLHIEILLYFQSPSH